MSLTLKLYLTNDSDNVINKTLTGTVAMAVRLSKDIDLLRPVFLLVEPASIDFKNFNYCEIVELNKYYFIRSIELVNNEVYRLICECDVLETYKSDILASECSYHKQISAGDYGEISNFTSTGKTIVTNYDSDVTLTLGNTNILTVMGLNNE